MESCTKEQEEQLLQDEKFIYSSANIRMGYPDMIKIGDSTLGHFEYIQINVNKQTEKEIMRIPFCSNAFIVTNFKMDQINWQNNIKTAITNLRKRKILSFEIKGSHNKILTQVVNHKISRALSLTHQCLNRCFFEGLILKQRHLLRIFSCCDRVKRLFISCCKLEEIVKPYSFQNNSRLKIFGIDKITTLTGEDWSVDDGILSSILKLINISSLKKSVNQISIGKGLDHDKVMKLRKDTDLENIYFHIN
ncbi:unnamed protein product [Moneuplotes crassus]|uniref:Uncharacterized protein n=1 Tax=Euplotes crassus TaxID=5936 RepID=A0AAD1XTY5_EUPCR|nr:unnamed protein product [Moneuplotes crassus]